MVQPGSVSVLESGMSGDSPHRDGGSQRGCWDRQCGDSSILSPHLSYPLGDIPGLAENICKPALVPPAPWQVGEAWGGESCIPSTRVMVEQHQLLPPPDPLDPTS